MDIGMKWTMRSLARRVRALALFVTSSWTPHFLNQKIQGPARTYLVSFLSFGLISFFWSHFFLLVSFLSFGPSLFFRLDRLIRLFSLATPTPTCSDDDYIKLSHSVMYAVHAFISMAACF
jgi:hypothetical protein